MTANEDLKRMLRKKKKKDSFKRTDYVSTGSTILDLSCTGHIGCGFKKGHYYLLVGDSMSGKTWISHTILAEASINKSFDDYRFIYNDSEGGALMDIRKYFGRNLYKRLEPPDGTRKDPIYSDSVEHLYDSIDDALEEGTPFIFIQDSMDALNTEADEKKLKELKRAREKGKIDTQTGTYALSKPKINSSRLRSLMSKLRKTGSILVILSQTRDNIGFGFETQTRAGGRSLTFYATFELWLSVRERIKKTVKGRPRTIGTLSKVRVKKNRVQGKDRTAHIPIYYSSGIDDVGGNISWLIEEKHWSGTKAKVKAPEFDFDGTIEKLVQKIEEEEEEKTLKKLVSSVWNEIEEGCQVERKNKYNS